MDHLDHYAPLKTYLRTYRRQTSLTQEEVAFLLGSMCGTVVLRHEKGTRMPLLRILLAYSFIYDVDVKDLYEGVDQEVQTLVRKRARGLLVGLERRPANAVRKHKIAHLKSLLKEEA